MGKLGHVAGLSCRLLRSTQVIFHGETAKKPPADANGLYADPERLARVLGNLMSNSLRYTSAGGEIVLTGRAENGDQVRITVADDGKGIAPEALPYIFDRLYRADPARSTEESGLGLAVAQSIVEAHGGSIAADSTLGNGTTMTILLPVRGAGVRAQT